MAVRDSSQGQSLALSRPDMAFVSEVGRKCAVSSSEDSLQRAEELLERLEEARTRLEATEDPEAAIETLSELAEIAKQVEAELTRAKRVADADA